MHSFLWPPETIDPRTSFRSDTQFIVGVDFILRLRLRTATSREPKSKFYLDGRRSDFMVTSLCRSGITSLPVVCQTPGFVIVVLLGTPISDNLEDA